MSQLNISTRLLILIGMLSALLVGVGTLGLFGIVKANDTLKSVYEDRAVPLVQLGDVQHQVMRNRLDIANSVLDPSPEAIAKNVSDLEANLALTQKQWDAYMATYLTPKEAVWPKHLPRTTANGWMKGCARPWPPCAPTMWQAHTA
jgi:hypothetical protein